MTGRGTALEDDKVGPSVLKVLARRETGAAGADNDGVQDLLSCLTAGGHGPDGARAGLAGRPGLEDEDQDVDAEEEEERGGHGDEEPDVVAEGVDRKRQLFEQLVDLRLGQRRRTRERRRRTVLNPFGQASEIPLAQTTSRPSYCVYITPCRDGQRRSGPHRR